MLKILQTVFLLLNFLLPTLRADSTNKFRVGIISPLSGALAEYGVATRNGLELALENKLPGIDKMQFYIEDDQYDPKLSVSAFNKLRDLNQVNLVFLFGTAPGSAVIPLAERYQLPLLSASLDLLAVAGKQWTIRVSNYPAQFADILLKYLRAKGVKRIGMVRAELGYFNTLHEALLSRLKADESVVDVFVTNPSDNDVNGIVAAVRKHKLDALGVYLLNGPIANFYKLCPSEALPPITFGSDCFESASEIQAAQGKMEGAVFPNSRVTENFAEQYRKKYGNEYQINSAAYVYDMIGIVGHYLQSQKDFPSGLELLKHLRTVKNYHGAFSTVSYQDNAEGGKYFELPLVLRQVTNNAVQDYDG